MTIQRHIRAIVEILEDLGIVGGRVERDSKHIKVMIDGPGGSRKVVTSKSPSDHRAMLNFRSDLRRIAREIGALPA